MKTIFETPRTIVRQYLLGDINDAFEWMGNSDVASFNYWTPFSLEQTEAQVTRLAETPVDQMGRWNEYAVQLKTDGKMIGSVNARPVDNVSRQCEIGYQFNPAYQGLGLATEAVAGLLSYLFQRLNIHRVFANADVRNKRSIKLMKRLGMRREALHLENVWNKGEWNDEVIYAILRREWLRRGR